MANTIDLTGDLPLVVPVKGATNWDEDMKNKTFQKIADHDHTAGKGSQIDTAALKDNAVTNAKMADNAVDTAEIVDSAVTEIKLNTNAVTTAKIKDSTGASDGVTTAKLATNAVTEAKIADNAIQIEHKKTYGPTTLADDGAGITPSGNSDLVVDFENTVEAFHLKYKLKRGSTYQIGDLEGVVGSTLIDSFVGTDLAVFSWDTGDTTKLLVNGNASDVLTYSIEFLE